MTYKCGCNWEGQTKRELVAHMRVWHGCGFKEGDPELVQLSQEFEAKPEISTFAQFVRGGA